MILMKNALLLSLLIILNSCGGGGGGNETNEIKLKPVLENLNFPIRLESLDKNNLIFAELLTGNLNRYNLKTNEVSTFATFPAADKNLIGISGLLVDNDYNNNHFIYIYHVESASNKNVITRLTISDTFSVIERKIIRFLDAPSGHNGGGMIQNSNGDILLGTGDGGNPNSSQSQDDNRGKIIIFNRDVFLVHNNSI